MKAKFKTIGIRSSEDALKDAAEAMQTMVQGRKNNACFDVLLYQHEGISSRTDT